MVFSNFGFSLENLKVRKAVFQLLPSDPVGCLGVLHLSDPFKVTTGRSWLVNFVM